MHDAFKALGDPHRLEIVRLALAEPRHVQALADALRISQPAVSRHVSILERAGLIAVSRVGRRTEIHAPPPNPSRAVATLLSLIQGSGRDPSVAARRETATGIEPSRGRRHPVREEIEDYLL